MAYSQKSTKKDQKMKKLKYSLFALLSSVSLYANNVDCIILEDENSIVCKYTHTRVSHPQDIVVQWIEPDGSITRERDMIIPAHHGSIYDYRYISGRTKGLWHFKVIDDDQEYTTTFVLK